MHKVHAHRWLHSTHRTECGRMDSTDGQTVCWRCSGDVAGDLGGCSNCLLGLCAELRQAGCCSDPPPPPPPPPLLHNSNPNTLSPLQPLWRPLQPRPSSSSSSCPSSFHPVYSPLNSFIHSSPKRHICALLRDVLTLFFLLPNLRQRSLLFLKSFSCLQFLFLFLSFLFF